MIFFPIFLHRSVSLSVWKVSSFYPFFRRNIGPVVCEIFYFYLYSLCIKLKTNFLKSLGGLVFIKVGLEEPYENIKYSIKTKK